MVQFLLWDEFPQSWQIHLKTPRLTFVCVTFCVTFLSSLLSFSCLGEPCEQGKFLQMENFNKSHFHHTELKHWVNYRQKCDTNIHSEQPLENKSFYFFYVCNAAIPIFYFKTHFSVMNNVWWIEGDGDEHSLLHQELWTIPWFLPVLRVTENSQVDFHNELRVTMIIFSLLISTYLKLFHFYRVLHLPLT